MMVTSVWWAVDVSVCNEAFERLSIKCVGNSSTYLASSKLVV